MGDRPGRWRQVRLDENEGVSTTPRINIIYSKVETVYNGAIHTAHNLEGASVVFINVHIAKVDTSILSKQDI